jgi:hypothetical protein
MGLVLRNISRVIRSSSTRLFLPVIVIPVIVIGSRPAFTAIPSEKFLQAFMNVKY